MREPESGTAVEILNCFERRWSRGFEVVERMTDGYRVRRLSDGSVLPVVFAEDVVRPDPARAVRTDAAALLAV